MALSVTSVEVLDDRRLKLSFSDGVVREVDVSFLMRGPLGDQLTDPAYFRRVRVDRDARTIIWPNGLDPDPDILHGDFEPTPTTRRERVL